MKKQLAVICLIQALLHVHTWGQSLTNKGTDFWVGYGLHESMEVQSDDAVQNSQNLVLYLSAEKAAVVTVTVLNTGWTRTYSVPANSVIVTDALPKDPNGIDCRLFTASQAMVGGTGTQEGYFRKHGIFIKSDEPIVAYAHMLAKEASGATMLMPVDTWGYSYTSLNNNQTNVYDGYSYAYVVASHDKTVVEITPTVLTRSKHAANTPFRVTLNKGEIYQLVAQNTLDVQPELTGSAFRSVGNEDGECFPIAVFSGSSITFNAMKCGHGAGDGDMVQLLPAQTWGKKYITAPYASSEVMSKPMTSGFKVLVNDPATVVWLNGTPLTGLLQNSYYYFESNTPNVIEANKPVMVAQSMSGGDCGVGRYSDPDLLYLSPVEQSIPKVIFFRNNQIKVKVNYLVMVVPNRGTGLSSVRIDGKAITSLASWEVLVYPHPQQPQYSVVVRRWSDFTEPPTAPPGQCTVTCDSGFTAVTYGLGSYESYSYNAGTYLNNLHAENYMHNVLDSVSPRNAYTCINAPVTLSVLLAFKPTNLFWQVSAMGGVSTPAADVNMSSPVAADTISFSGAAYYEYRLPGRYIFNKAGIYTLPVELSSLGAEIDRCSHKEMIYLRIEVREQPVVDFSFDQPAFCARDTVRVTGNAFSTNGYTLHRWNWLFAGSGTDTGMHAGYVLAAAASQPVKLTAITYEGCIADVTKNTTVYAPPVADFTASSGVVCENGSYTFTGNATYAGATPLQWNWYFGNGDKSVTATGTAAETYKSYGDYTVKLVVKASDLCGSDTVAKPVKVWANPATAISFPAGCLPAEGKVHFVNNTAVPDGQAVQSHAWNFGDAAATSANPNTSSATSPMHTFGYNTYAVTYKAVSEKGCVKDTAMQVKFNPAPLFSYPTLEAVCENASALSVAKAAVTNGVTGTGIYKGTATTAEGLFTPATAGTGGRVIWYVYTTAEGCADSVQQSITVLPVPTAGYTFTNGICAGAPGTFTPTATIAAGSTISKWNWSFGDGTTALKTSGSAFDYTYAAYGSYNATLTVTSGDNCTSPAAEQTIQVNAVPVAGFTMPDRICLPGDAAVFTNTTTIASGEALSWQWNYGMAGATATTQNGNYTYSQAGAYAVQLTATSAKGCTHSVIKTLSRFFNKPTASFLPEPAAICAGEPVTFTDKSTATGSTINSWNWRFSDGYTATVKNVTRRFTDAGTVTATLVVKTAEDCVSTPAEQAITIHELPVIDAGASFVVQTGAVVRFGASARSNGYAFQWTPAADLSDAHILNPSLTASDDKVYMLIANTPFNCTARDSLSVKVLRNIQPPNVFTPNGDGVHDVWEIANLAYYSKAVVQVFNRYGQKVYMATGYNKPWDGTLSGKALPSGTYYYIINLGLGGQPLTGPVTILR